jgi:hypothetical protein
VQDPTVIILVFAYGARNGRFEHFFERNDLRPLGVRMKFGIFFGIRNVRGYLY